MKDTYRHRQQLGENSRETSLSNWITTFGILINEFFITTVGKLWVFDCHTQPPLLVG